MLQRAIVFKDGKFSIAEVLVVDKNTLPVADVPETAVETAVEEANKVLAKTQPVDSKTLELVMTNIIHYLDQARSNS